MRQSSLTRQLDFLIRSEFTTRGWSESEGVFYKVHLPGVILAISTLTGSTKKFSGGIPGRCYYPTVFLIHQQIEIAYNTFRSVDNSAFPNSVGTLSVTPNWIRLGCPPFFKKSIPTLRDTVILGRFDDDSVDDENWCRHIASQSPPYFLTNREFRRPDPSNLTRNLITGLTRVPPSEIVPRDPAKLEAEVIAMINQISQSAQFLTDKAPSVESTVALAISATADLNTAVLFGADWMFRVPFILLMYGKTEHAVACREMLDQINWSRLFNFRPERAARRMQSLFDFFQSGLFNQASLDSTEYPVEEALRRVKNLVTKPFNFSKETDSMEKKAVPFTFGIPGGFL